MLKEVVQYLLLRRGAAKHNSAPLAPFLRRSKNGDDFIQNANPQRQHKWVLRASETVIAGRPANAGRAYSAGSEIETSAAKKPMQHFLAFIPRKWRLARWQVLLGAAVTFAWWLFLYNRLGHFSVAPVDLPPLHGPWSDEDLRAYSAKLYGMS